MILLSIILFIISELFFYFHPFKEESYYYIKRGKFRYTGIHFNTIKEGLKLLVIQTGIGGYDKCITICNISLIFNYENNY